MVDLAVRLALQAVENRVHLEPVLRVSVRSKTLPHRAPGWRSAGVKITQRLNRPVAIGTVRVPVSIQISDRKIMARWLTRCSRPRHGGVFDFSMDYTLRAIGQSPTRNALVSENFDATAKACPIASRITVLCR